MPGPAPDPDALRRDRKDDAAGWTSLPSEGFAGAIPVWPISAGSELAGSEAVLWDKVWRKPQAAQWSRLGLEYQVAAYVRAFIESTEGESTSAGLTTAVLRMEDGLGISFKGMMTLRWKIVADEVSARRVKPAVVKLSATERLRARSVEAG